MQYLFLILLIFITYSPAGAEDKVREPIAAPTLDVSFPLNVQKTNVKASVYEFNDDSNFEMTIGDIIVAKDISELAIGNIVSSVGLKIKKGIEKKFVFILQNNSDRVENIFIGGVALEPEKNALGNSFECLCEGRLMQIPPRSLIALPFKVSVRKNGLGDRVFFRVPIFGLDEKNFSEVLQKRAR
ncbi:MAG: hypothetical protein ACLGGX_04995 [Bdellovibrionia bacterium]